MGQELASHARHASVEGGRDVMAAILDELRHIKSPTQTIAQSMHIYLKNNPAEFQVDPIWNVRALGFFKPVARPNNSKNNNYKRSSDMGSVPVPKEHKLKINVE